MIWVALWALALVAFLAFFFRGHLLEALLWALGLVAVIGTVFVQVALGDLPGYGRFVERASRIGWDVLIFAIAVVVTDLVGVVVYTLRRGRSEIPRGTVIREDRPLSGMYVGYPSLMGRSMRKVLRSKGDSITMESLVDGTASFGERLMASGIVALFVGFFLIWVGASLILMKQLLILALLPILPGLFVYHNLRAAWTDYREAKRGVAAR